MSRARLLVWLVVAVLLPAFTRRALHVHAAAPAPTRHSIKINPGPTEATATPTLPSHTFSMPLPTAPPASTPQSQARAINAAEMSQRARRPPANFSLPPPLLADWQSDGGNVPGSEMYEEALWRRWDGDCMHLRQDSYHYTLCPFHNITQRGLQLTSLNVLLGVWSGWWTTPSRELAMNFTDGTRCSDRLHRSTTLLLHCSAPRSVAHSAAPMPAIDTLAEYSPSYIAQIDEPAACVYFMHWHTPLVCSAYQQAAQELERRRDSSSALSSASTRSDAEHSVQLMRQLSEEMAVEDGLGKPRLQSANGAEARGRLDCIAAMSAPDASVDSYRAACAAYMPSDAET